MKILIADDDPVVVTLLQRSLPRDLEAVVARDGRAAWAILLQEDCPHLAILDWMMPGLTGPEICRLARTNPHTRDVYIILLTMKSALQDMASGICAGASDFLTKPFSIEEVQFRIRLARGLMEKQACETAREV